jgi:hypothetical protein
MIVKVAWIFIHSIFSSWSKVTDSVCWFNIGLCLLCTTFFVFMCLYVCERLCFIIHFKWNGLKCKQAKLNQWKLKKRCLGFLCSFPLRREVKSKSSLWFEDLMKWKDDFKIFENFTNWNYEKYRTFFQRINTFWWT